MRTLKILCVHGLGDHRQSSWNADWERTIRAAMPGSEPAKLDFAFHTYDHIFEDTDISFLESIKAVGKLTASGIGSLFRRSRPRKSRGVGGARGVSHFLRWYAGYVVAWTEDKRFQRRTRRAFLKALVDEQPNVILAHSLGSLVTYNAMTHDDASDDRVKAALKKTTYISLGSQIGNAFVVGNLTHGRVAPLPVRWWFHLYNREDDVFTAPIRLWDATNFTQVDTFFDVDGWMDHDAVHYLGHAATRALVWDGLAHDLLPRSRGKKAPKGDFVPALAAQERSAAKARAKRPPRRRALLVGINDYPSEEDRLEGCVNDVFLMSSVLQECGFEAEDIRTCLDRRATAHDILDRLDWLLDDPQDDDSLVFYYSGHGAQLPTYGEGEKVDHMDETLVPWDFDWSEETCITDDQIFELYSQLPYGTNLVKIFDCCHSGGIHRAGAPRAKGLNPPDDIRHRRLHWNREMEMWQDRQLSRINRAFTKEDGVEEEWFGKEGVTSRLGRGSFVRGMKSTEYEKAKKGTRPVGPFLPVILQACQEDQYAYEYRHGVTSYGAFTYSLASILRRERRLSFHQLVLRAADQLEHLGYAQHPQILGPRKVLAKRVPWMGA